MEKYKDQLKVKFLAIGFIVIVALSSLAFNVYISNPELTTKIKK